MAQPSKTDAGLAQHSLVSPIEEEPRSSIDSATRPSAAASLPATPGPLSPSGSAGPSDRVFPIRSVVSVDPTATPKAQHHSPGDYFHPWSRTNDQRYDSRRMSQESTASQASQASLRSRHPLQSSTTTPKTEQPPAARQPPGKLPRRVEPSSGPVGLHLPFNSSRSVDEDSRSGSLRPEPPASPGASSTKSRTSSFGEIGLVTHRFKHVTTEGGHMIVTGRGGDVLQRCEDEPIHIPGAVQGFGLIVAVSEDLSENGNLLVRIVSENSKRIIGYTPKELFALESFTDILSDEQADNLLDHIDFIKDEDADVVANGPEVFTIAVKVPGFARNRKLWCALHIADANPGLIICEFELEDDPLYPLVPPNEMTPDLPEDTLSSNPTAEELLDSTEIKSKPLRVLRSARKRKGEAAAMEVFNIMSQVQEQLAAAPSLDKFLKVLVGVIKELTGFHRVMIYQFDHTFNGRVVTELVDPRATKDLYKGLNFPASDIPKQARDLYKLNKVRMLYDRDQETARLVCRTAEDLENPLDMTHSYLRAMSPIHIKYLTNMAVRSSMSVSINAFNELWGLIACHSYGPRGMRVSFPIRKMCRMVGDAASRNIERLSYASRLQARKLINTAPSSANPSGYIIASSDDLLKLFNADFGCLSIRDETKILGTLDSAQEALAMLEYLRMRKIQSVMTSTDIVQDFPDLRYPPGFHIVAGMLIVPLSVSGTDFIVFFRRGQLREVKWAGNPYEKFVKEGTEGYLEPRKSFKTWSETVVGKCREWTEEEIETASVLCLVYGKFIEVWRQKEAAVESSQLTRLLLANSAHEVRTPLNAIINYLEIALEGVLDTETRENLARSHSASKSLIYVINDLLDLTKTEEGGRLIKGESFHLKDTIKEATDMFRGDARRKNIAYEVVEHPGLPQNCIGDQRRVRQAISNITANAIQHTTQGSVKVEAYVAARPEPHRVELEVAVTDTGAGMNTKQLDQLFFALEQVQSEPISLLDDASFTSQKEDEDKTESATLGLGLAIVARIIKNMNGQLRIRSEEGKGTRFVIQFPFDLPESEGEGARSSESPEGSITPQPETPGPGSTADERTLIGPSLSRHTTDERLADSSIVRRSSLDSLKSRASTKSRASFKSFKSGSSQRSDVDRLIDAIQEPHMVSKRNAGNASSGSHSLRPPLTKHNSLDLDTYPRKRSRSLEHLEGRIGGGSQYQSSLKRGIPGEHHVNFSAVPLKAVRMPDEENATPETGPKFGVVLRELNDKYEEVKPIPENLTAENMRVLVAEDDPVNSRIVQKRLEKLKHNVHLTVNGEECASAFCDNSRDFDVVLMDMQMPIVDGLTSAKMIRSYEKMHTNIYSPRAKLCGRVPIIAVSASLVERDRQKYIDGGFDAWILKPIPFDRLNQLLAGIVDKDIRKEFLYQPGRWERGGWFHMGKKSSDEANTKPSGEPPVSDPSKGMQDAAHTEDPLASQGGSTDKRDVEQARLMQNQAEGKTESPKDESGAPQPEESEDALPAASEEAPKGESEEPPKDAVEEQVST